MQALSTNATLPRRDAIALSRPHSAPNDLAEALHLRGIAHAYLPKQTIYFEGDRADRFFQIVEGTVKLFKLASDGRCQVTGFAYPGDILGLEFGNSHSLNAEAISSVVVREHTRAEVERIAERHPQLHRQLLSKFSAELSAAREHLLLLGRKSPLERLCSFLVSRLEADELVGGEGDRLCLPMSRSDIGDYLGLTIETVSRKFTKLRTKGVIALPDSKHVVVLDRDTLMDLAAGDEEIRLH